MDIYDFIEFLDNKIIENESNGDEFSYSFLNYNIVSDTQISISCGWSSPEEGYGNEITINFISNNNIQTDYNYDGHSVYGDYDDSGTYNFKNIENLIEYVNNEC